MLGKGRGREKTKVKSLPSSFPFPFPLPFLSITAPPFPFPSIIFCKTSLCALLRFLGNAPSIQLAARLFLFLVLFVNLETLRVGGAEPMEKEMGCKRKKEEEKEPWMKRRKNCKEKGRGKERVVFCWYSCGSYVFMSATNEIIPKGTWNINILYMVPSGPRGGGGWQWLAPTTTTTLWLPSDSILLTFA